LASFGWLATQHQEEASDGWSGKMAQIPNEDWGSPRSAQEEVDETIEGVSEESLERRSIYLVNIPNEFIQA
jgi:hypothetical protein